MDDGMKRATLDAVLSRAPWVVSQASVTSSGKCTITADEMRAAYDAYVAGDWDVGVREALGVPFRSARKVDRATAILKRAGLIRFVGGKWEAV